MSLQMKNQASFWTWLEEEMEELNATTRLMIQTQFINGFYLLDKMKEEVQK